MMQGAIAIDDPHRENIPAIFEIRATFRSRRDRTGPSGDLAFERAMTLLEHGPQVDHRVDLRAGRRIALHGRIWVTRQSRDPAEAESSRAAKRKRRHRPSALTVWARWTGLSCI